MSFISRLSTATTAAIITGVLTATAVADGPVYSKPTYTAPVATESYDRPHIGNWGGLYMGANIGWQHANIDGDFVQTPDNNHNVDHSASVLGGQVGLQHQFGMFVVGVEAGYSGTGAFSGWGDSVRGGTPDCLIGNPNRTCQGRLDSLFTVGPRLGIARENWLFFASGGFASARVDTRTINITTGADASITAHRHNGWYLGGGFERLLHNNWVWGLEYQHVWLDTERHFSSLQGGCCTVGSSTRDLNADADIIRLRLSYKFGRPEPKPESYK